MVFSVALLLVLLPVCTFAPGFFFVRRLAWNPLEKLCGSIGLSLILLYLAMWGIFCFGPHDERIACWAVACGAAILGGLAWKDAWRLLRTFRVRQAVRWFGVLAAFTAAMLGMIRVYSGGPWAVDWLEHFHRSLFFLNRLPLMVPMFPSTPVPSRPPLMNVLAAFFMGLTDDQFVIFQLVFAFLNLLVFFSCLLILPALGGSRRRSVIPLAVLFAASPVLMEAATYTWTKSLPAFFVVLALSLYLSGLRKDDGGRILAAFLAMAAGLLAHYSAGPYVVFLALHFAVRMVRRREWKLGAAIAVSCGLLLATWFGWSASVYGWKTTLASNTSVAGVQEHSGSNAGKIAANLFDTIVPVWMRGGFPTLEQAAGAPETRDEAFLFYQGNLIFAMGVVGGPLVLLLLYRVLRRPGRERMFWMLLLPACIVLGVAVVGERDPNGVPHLTLLSLELVGITLVAAHFASFGRVWRLVLIAGLMVDFWFGISLQARVENLENTPARTVYPVVFDDRVPRQFDGGQSVGRDTWVNWTFKWRYLRSANLLANMPNIDPGLRAHLEEPRKEDASYWDGWARRHGGTFQYLGDIAGDSGGELLNVGFHLLFLGLLVVLWRSGRPAPAASPPARAEVRRRKKVARR